MEYDVFISYSRKDTAIVDQFVNRLTEAGYRVWIDREGIYSGDYFATNIVEAIENSKILLFFSSANSNASEWTVKEIYYALSEHKTIIPIKIDTAKYDKRVALNLILVDFIQYQQDDFSSAAERLITSVAKHLGKNKSESNQKVNSDSFSEKPSKCDSQPATPCRTPSQPEMSSEELLSLGNTHYDNEDYEQAVDCYRKAAEQGFALAQFNLGVCYGTGRGVKQDDRQAVYWYLKAAEQGYVKSQFNLGVYYDNGQGVPQDCQQAVYWYLKAAEQGHALAQCSLGICYANGQGVQQDYKQAVYWYQKASEQGNDLAQSKLAVCYVNGQGVKQDYQQAVYWYRETAKQGNALAQCALGCSYVMGEGVRRNKRKARYWLRKSADQGYEEAKEALKLLQRKRRRWLWF